MRAVVVVVAGALALGQEEVGAPKVVGVTVRVETAGQVEPLALVVMVTVQVVVEVCVDPGPADAESVTVFVGAVGHVDPPDWVTVTVEAASADCVTVRVRVEAAIEAAGEVTVIVDGAAVMSSVTYNRIQYILLWVIGIEGRK